MAKNVLVPMDDSDPARDALRYAVSAFPEASITGLHVLDPTNHLTYGGDMGLAFSGDNLVGRKGREHASALFAEVTELAENEDREVETEVEEGRPSRVIVSYAEEKGFDHIVIGSHGRTGVKRLLLGSVAEAVVRRSPIPITVIREY